MKTIEQIAAEILVECNYADDINDDHLAFAHQCGKFGEDVDWEFRPIQWDKDTLEGRRQADAIEDSLAQEHTDLWMISEDLHPDNSSHHQWRLDRIKWCLEQLRPEIIAKTAPKTD